ncbi:MAG: sigma-70 family RNA polymerase sigma factor [Halioglobus sp.]
MNRNREQAEVVELYKEASPELLRLLHRRLGNRQDAEEVAQDAFEKLCSLEQREEIRDLRNYFFTMANRMALNVLRRRNTEKDYLIKQGPLLLEESDASFDPAEIARWDEKLRLVKHAIQSLPKKTGYIFLLHRFEGYTYPEIAQKLGMSKKSVEYHMCRALSTVVKATQGG